VTPDEASATAVAADLASASFLAGVARGNWRRVAYSFPILTVAVAAVEPDGSRSEYAFRFELTGFRAVAPEARIWDLAVDKLLATHRRPKGSPRVVEAFKSWGDETVYRPWDRRAGAHSNWAQRFPALRWHPERDLTFVLEDLSGLLTSNALARGDRPAA
jgi:hypothetical protein